MYYFSAINYVKVQICDSLRHNNYRDESKNVNDGSIIDEFIAKKTEKTLIINNNLI